MYETEKRAKNTIITKKCFNMEIKDGAYVVFTYTLSLDTGEALDLSEAEQPIGFAVGYGHMLPSIEKRLLGMLPGEHATIFLEPGEAFGKYDPDAMRNVPRANFPDDIEVRPTMPFMAEGPGGPITFVVKEVGRDSVVVDMNHPLAGRRIRCDIEIHEVRELTRAEQAKLGRKMRRRRSSISPFDPIPDDELQM